MRYLKLIRERWHSNSTTPQEREFLIELMAAIREDLSESVKNLEREKFEKGG